MDGLEYFLMKLNEKNAEIVAPFPMVEHVDAITPILDSITYFAELLKEDKELNFLDANGAEALNESIIELSRMVVAAFASPRMLVKYDV